MSSVPPHVDCSTTPMENSTHAHNSGSCDGCCFWFADQTTAVPFGGPTGGCCGSVACCGPTGGCCGSMAKCPGCGPWCAPEGCCNVPGGCMLKMSGCPGCGPMCATGGCCTKIPCCAAPSISLPDGPCGECFAFLRRYFFFFIAGFGVLILIGIILLALGLKNIANAEASTTGAEFLNRNTLYAHNSKSEIASTTGTVKVGPTGTPIAISTVSQNSSYQLSSVNKTWPDTYITASIPTSSLPTSGSVSFTLSLTYSLSCDGCGTGTVASGNIVSASIPVTSAGSFVKKICVVIMRDALNTAFIIDEDQASCFYPFDSDSNKYAGGPVPSAGSNVELVVRSKYDFGYFFLEEQSKGTLNMADEKILLVDPATPGLLGGGAFLLFLGISLMCVFACCFRPSLGM